MSAQLALPWRSLTDLPRRTIYVVVSDIASSLGMSEAYGEGKLLERLKRNGEFLIQMDEAHFSSPTPASGLPARELPLPTGAAPLPTPASGLPARELPLPTGAAPLPTGAAPLPTGAAPLPTGAAPLPVQNPGFSPTGKFVWCTDYLGLTTAIWGSRAALSEEIQAYWRGVINGIPFALAESLERETAAKLRETELQLQLQHRQHAAQLRAIEQVAPGASKRSAEQARLDEIKTRVQKSFADRKSLTGHRAW